MNPFITPDQAKAAAELHVQVAALTINDQIARGHRVFHVPKGLASLIQDQLGQLGWNVISKTHPTDPDGSATVVLVGPGEFP